MQAAKANLFTRDDTMLGVCEALGNDLGVHPNLLRVTLGVMLIWQPVATVCAYLGAAVVVLASRLIFPDRKRPAREDMPAAVHRLPASSAPDGRAEEIVELAEAA